VDKPITKPATVSDIESRSRRSKIANLSITMIVDVITSARN